MPARVGCLLIPIVVAATWEAGLCLAQTPSDAPAIESEQAATLRIEGALTRPQARCDHAALDAAWVDYQVALKAASDSVRGSIGELFEAATAKGDLEAAEKWQAVAERFESAGVLPRHPELRPAMTAMENQLKKAEKELLAAYNDAVKALTIDKHIDAAKAVRDERDAVLQARSSAPSKSQSSDEGSRPKKGMASKTMQADQWADITREMLGGMRRGNVIVVRPNGERVSRIQSIEKTCRWLTEIGIRRDSGAKYNVQWVQRAWMSRQKGWPQEGYVQRFWRDPQIPLVQKDKYRLPKLAGKKHINFHPRRTRQASEADLRWLSQAFGHKRVASSPHSAT